MEDEAKEGSDDEEEGRRRRPKRKPGVFGKRKTSPAPSKWMKKMKISATVAFEEKSVEDEGSSGFEAEEPSAGPLPSDKKLGTLASS